LAQAGGKNVLLIPVGFVSDHVEILYDIDVLFRDYGKARGIAVRRSESLNASAKFAAALASLVTARIEEVSGVRCQVSGSGPADT
jgi:ferrochelatase